MDGFSLDLEETRVMYSLEYHLVLADIDSENDFGIRSLKQKWLQQWKESIENFLEQQISQTSDSTAEYSLITELSILDKKLEVVRTKLKIKRIAILLQVILFKLYYPLGKDEDNTFKDLKVANKDDSLFHLKSYAQKLSLSTSCVERFKKNYREAKDQLKGGSNNFWGAFIGAVIFAIAAAFFTPAIAMLLAPLIVPGLSGAAAVSAVLAFLGGGAIAIGGLGMAGGFTALVAGGAILGVSAGATVGLLFTQSSHLALEQAAELVVIFKEIVFVERDKMLAKEILKQQRQAISSIEERLDELLTNSNTEQKEIENLKKSISYINKALEINRGFLEKYN